MAKRTSGENTGLTELRAALKSGEVANVYIFYGEEAYLCRHYLQELRRLLVPAGFEEFNFHRLAGQALRVQDLADAVEAMPMMAEHTLVTVTDFDIFKLDERGRSQLIELLRDFPDYCTLVFHYDLIPYKRDGKMKNLCQALDGVAREVEFTQQEHSQLFRWAQKRFAALGRELDRATADHLFFTCGTWMTELIPEIEKIGAYAKGPSITVADIDAVADPILDARIFDMTNQITAGRYDEAARALGELLRMQMEPTPILGAIGKELRRLYTARIALDHGKDRGWYQKLWGMKSDYPAKLMMQAAKRVRPEWCREAVMQCQVLDRRMKSERGMDKEAELKLFLMRLAGER